MARTGTTDGLPGQDRLVVCLNLYRTPRHRSDVDSKTWNDSVVRHNTDIASAVQAFRSSRSRQEAHSELEILRFVGDCTLVFFPSGDLGSAIDWLVQDMPMLAEKHRAAGPHGPWGVRGDLPATRAGIADGAIVHYYYPQDQRPGLANDSIGSPIDIAFQLAHLAAPGQVLLDMATMAGLVDGIDKTSQVAASDDWVLQLDSRPTPSPVGQVLWDDVKSPALPIRNVAEEIRLLSAAQLCLANLEALIVSERSFCDRVVRSPEGRDPYQSRVSNARRQFVGVEAAPSGDALAPIQTAITRCLSLSLPAFEHVGPPIQLWKRISGQLAAYVDLLDASDGVLVADQETNVSQRGVRSMDLLRMLDVTSLVRRLGEELASTQWALTS